MNSTPCNIKFIVSPSLQVAVQRVLSRPWFLGRAQLLFGFFWCPNLSNIIFSEMIRGAMFTYLHNISPLTSCYLFQIIRLGNIMVSRYPLAITGLALKFQVHRGTSRVDWNSKRRRMVWTLGPGHKIHQNTMATRQHLVASGCIWFYSGCIICKNKM